MVGFDVSSTVCRNKFSFFCLGLNFILSSVSSVGLIITAQCSELGSFKLDFGLALLLAHNLLLDSSRCPFCLCTPRVSRTRTLCFVELVVLVIYVEAPSTDSVAAPIGDSNRYCVRCQHLYPYLVKDISVPNLYLLLA